MISVLLSLRFIYLFLNCKDIQLFKSFQQTKNQVKALLFFCCCRQQIDLYVICIARKRNGMFLKDRPYIYCENRSGASMDP